LQPAKAIHLQKRSQTQLAFVDVNPTSINKVNTDRVGFHQQKTPMGQSPAKLLNKNASEAVSPGISQKKFLDES